MKEEGQTSRDEKKERQEKKEMKERRAHRGQDGGAVLEGGNSNNFTLLPPSWLSRPRLKPNAWL